MASAKEYNMLFKLSAALSKEFGGTFSSAQKTLSETQKEIKALGNQQANIAGYTRQQQSVEKTNQKLEVYKKQLSNVQQEMQQSEKFSSELANKEVELQAKIKSTEERLASQTSKLDQMGEALSESGVDVGNLTGESARLDKQLDELREAMKKAGAEAKSFGDTGADAFSAIGDAIVSAGIAMAIKEIYSAYKECVSMAGEFAETMSTVEALSGASSKEIEQLSTLAKELGATTKFTANEAAEAMTYMGMAGWNAQQMMAGMDGVLQLAAASGEDLGTVSDIVTDDLTAFGLAASDAGHFADILAAASTSSNTNVGLMGETFKYVAPLFGTMKWSAEDAAVAVGLMANAGIKGTQAGTSLKTALANLIAPSQKMKTAMDELDISITKADGTTMDFGEIMEMLRDRFAGLSEQEQATAASIIFGKEAMSGMLNIINASDADFQKLSNSIENCSGSAKRMAEIKLDNLNGQVTLMNSAADALKTTIGEAFMPELKALATTSANILSQINDFAVRYPVILKSIIAITAEVGGFLVVYKTYKTVKTAVNALSALGTTLKKADAAASAAQAAATAAQTGATISATGAQHGLNAAMAANPIGLILTGIAALTVGIIAITEKIRSSVAEVNELTEASRNLDAVMNDTDHTYRDAEASIIGQASLTEQYISQLKILEKQGMDTREEQEAYAMIVEKLNALYPDLNAELDKETGLLKGGIKAVEDYGAAWKESALQKAIAAKHADEVNAWLAADAELATNRAKLEMAKAEHEDLKKRYSEASAAFMKAAKGKIVATDETEKLRLAYVDLAEQLRNNENNQKNLNEAIAQGEKNVADAKVEVDAAKQAYDAYMESMVDTADATELSSENTQILNDNIRISIEKLSDLAEEYKSVQDAAEKSVSGQYALWDTAAVVIVTKIDDINTALASQSDYWSDYNTDLESLQSKAQDIEGLSDVIASFADGSTESVNAIAGMASASDEDLKKMVENWQAVKKEQEAVVESIKNISLGDELDRLQGELEQAVEDMNLETEAYNSAKATMDAYIQAIKDCLPDVEDQAKRLASIFGISLDDDDASADAAYASGTTNAARGVALVGERGPELVFFGGGEQVMTAEETRTALSPLPMKQSSQIVDISIAPQFVVNGEPTDLDDRLREFATVLVAEVQDAISEAGIDAKRGAYA